MTKSSSIEANTKSFQDITATDLMHELRKSRLIGFGENPHSVKEYFPILRDVLNDLLVQGRHVLLLMEYEYWLNQALADFLHGKTDRFIAYTFHDPEAGVFYGAGLHQFYSDLQQLSQSFPDKLSCSHIDYFMNPINSERSELVKSIDQGKWETSKNIRQFQKETNLQQFAEAREQFLFQEANEAYNRYQPDAMVLLAGSSHACKLGGRPFGDFFVKSVMARLAERIDEKPISIRFAAIEGEFAKLEYHNKKLSKIAVNCEEWGQEDIQVEFKKSICKLTGDAFITNLSGLEMPETVSASYKDWTANYDYLMTLRHVSPDMPMNRS